MARLARSEVFSPDEVAIVHVISRVVRRCFLLGFDPVSGKNFDHRKVWVESRLIQLAACFGIDLLNFAILSNHFHLILRSRPDVVKEWSDLELARRWLTLCPERTKPDGSPEEPNEFELNAIQNDKDRVNELRRRLSDISWWMRFLCQKIGRQANDEDGESGRFFQGRFRAVRICDEESLLACAAYVDLNPIRAALAERLEDGPFTSAQRRIEALIDSTAMKLDKPGSSHDFPVARPKDFFLSPLSIEESSDPIGPCPSLSKYRCSDKGFLAITMDDYIELLDWTARKLATGKAGSTPTEMPPILDRLSLSAEAWTALVFNFGQLFCNVAGLPKTIEMTRSCQSQRRYYLRPKAKELLSSVGISASHTAC